MTRATTATASPTCSLRRGILVVILASCGIVSLHTLHLDPIVGDVAFVISETKEDFIHHHPLSTATSAARLSKSASEQTTENQSSTVSLSPKLRAAHPKQKGRLFVCGHSQRRLQNYLFDDFIHVDGVNGSYPTFEQHAQLELAGNYTIDDVAVIGMHGPCEGLQGGEDNKEYYKWIHNNFPGKALMVNGEFIGSWTGEGSWMISRRPTDVNKQNLFVTFMALTFVGTVPESEWPMITWADSPRHHLDNSNKTFLVYLASNCINYRARTALLLSQIGMVHHAECQPTYKPDKGEIKEEELMEVVKLYDVPGNKSNIRKAPNLESDWESNHKRLRGYKFCLVMENKAKDGYITEKIMMAFVGGCIPIYFGTTQIFDIFNPKAFIFWDIYDKEAFVKLQARVKTLHTNNTAYDEMLKQPVLVDGNETLKEYFSLTDNIGNGELKHRIRVMMGIDDDSM